MNLKELHARLGQIIEDNAKHGCPERNELPMIVEFFLNRKRAPFKRFFPINYASGSQLDFQGIAYMTLAVREREEIKIR